MTTFYFVLGMVTVLVIAEVVAAFIIIKTINSLKMKIKEHEYQFNDIHDRINDLHRNSEQEFQEVWRQLDSRLDKLESKLTTKQIIKG